MATSNSVDRLQTFHQLYDGLQNATVTKAYGRTYVNFPVEDQIFPLEDLWKKVAQMHLQYKPDDYFTYSVLQLKDIQYDSLSCTQKVANRGLCCLTCGCFATSFSEIADPLISKAEALEADIIRERMAGMGTAAFGANT